MTITVLVHGNPECAAVWDPLCAELRDREVVRLSPPGFGAPLPEGFPCSPLGYRDWLAGELETIGEPVDLVGHDVGGSTALAVAMARPDLIRSWVSDSLGVLHPEYAWHDLARTWQTPGVGERAVGGLMGGTVDERAARMVGLGFPEPVAHRVAEAQGPAMGRAILGFYRAAAQPAMAELGRDLPAAAARPGLAIVPTADLLVGSEAMRAESADRAKARVLRLEGLGHRWMVQDPARVARAFEEFWDGVPR